MNDAQGGPSLLAHGGSFSAGGYTFGVNQGLTLSNALTSDVYSIDLTFSFDAKSDWSKIVDFHGLTSDDGWYRYNTSLELYDHGRVAQSGAGTFGDNQSLRVTLTRDASHLVTQYLNGTFAGSYVDNANHFSFNQPGNVANFFMDDTATNRREAAGGTVSRIVIFDTALTKAQVEQVSAVPEPETYAMMLAGLGLMGAIVRRRKSKGLSA